jgi:hypothetical protein
MNKGICFVVEKFRHQIVAKRYYFNGSKKKQILQQSTLDYTIYCGDWD